MIPNFDQLYSVIPDGATEIRWCIPTIYVDEAILFFRSKVPDVRYIATESWSDDDCTNIKFTWDLKAKSK